jgi:hypothetical protein
LSNVSNADDRSSWRSIVRAPSSAAQYVRHSTFSAEQSRSSVLVCTPTEIEIPFHPLTPIKNPRIYIDLRTGPSEKWKSLDPADPCLATPLAETDGQYTS